MAALPESTDDGRDDARRQRPRTDERERRDGGRREDSPPDTQHDLADATTLDRESFERDLKKIAADLGWKTGEQATGPAPEPSFRPLGLGSMLGPYRLEEKIGSGGMGDIFLARDTREIDRIVALKVMRPHPRMPDEYAERFRREKKVNGRVDDIGIVPVYDVGEDRGWHYLVMKYFPGGSLAERVAKGGRMRDQEAAALLARVASAVHHCHRRNIVHRDLKPGNILFDEEGRPRVSDFGLARLMESDDERSTDHETSASSGSSAGDDEALTKGGRLGTLQYMAPEQLRRPAGAREQADIYSLGATLYRMVTGSAPFPAIDNDDTERMVLNDAPRPPRKLNPRVSRDLEAVCLKCLEKDPARRYESADKLAEDLTRIEQGRPTRALPPTPVRRLALWARRQPLVASLLAALLGTLVASLVVVTFFWLQAELGRRDLERNDYLGRVALAASSLAAGGIGLAEERLSGCPPALRGIEWWLLRHLVFEPPAIFTESGARPTLAVFGPDPASVLCAGQKGCGKVWDVETRSVISSLPGLPSNIAVWDAAWIASPGRPGRSIAAACTDGFLRIWTWDRGRIDAGPDLWRAPGVSRIAAHGRSGQILTGGSDGRVVRWNLDGKHEELARLNKAIWDVAIAPDGRSWAATGEDRRLWVGTFDGKQMPQEHELDDTGTALGYSADGRHLAVGLGNGRILLWDLFQRTAPKRLIGHHDTVNMLEFSPEGARLASCGNDGRVRLWDTRDGREVLSLELPSQVDSVSFSVDGRRLAACANGSVIVWDTATPPPRPNLDPETLFQHDTTIVTLSISGDGRLVAAAGGNGVVYVKRLDAAGAQVFQLIDPRVPNPQRVNAVAFLGDRPLLAVGGRDRAILVWDVEKRVIVRRFEEPGDESDRVSGLAWCPGGQRLASTHQSGRVLLWEMGPKTPARTLGTQEMEAYTVAVHPDGRLVATAGSDRAIWLWDAAEKRLAGHPLRGHTASIGRLSISQDGSLLASCGNDRKVIIWNLSQRAAMHTLEEHMSTVWDVAFSPDGRLLASAGADGVVIVWDVASGARLATLNSPAGGRACAVAFSPDGTFLISAGGGANHAVVRWDSSAWTKPPRRDGDIPPGQRSGADALGIQ
jgi:WD40 repeat protein/serine/threonine protein kinase